MMKNEANLATPEGYKQTRRLLIVAADRLTRAIRERESAAGSKDEIAQALAELERQRKLVVEMMAGCSFVIEWLETGRMPGSRRGIERRAGYQREVPTDPSLLGVMRDGRRMDEGGEASERSLALERALRGLTERERDCFRLSQAEGFTLAEVADMVRISKSSVGTYLLRARRKIELNVRAGGGSSVG